MSTISLSTFEQRVKECLGSPDESIEEFCRYAELCVDLLAALRASQATNRVIDAENEAFESQVERLQAWVNDLQAGMYINCVYCGHRYGPDSEVPATMADVLKAHIEKCPEHPMSALKTELAECNRAFVKAGKKVVRLREMLNSN